jgi:hypothetical protein
MAPTSSFSQFFASSEPPPPTNAFDSMRARVGSAITPAAQNAQAMQATVLPEKNPLCPNMSFKDRVRGCIGCMCIGMVLSFLGFMAWWGGHIGTFAVIYTLGNLVALCSTGYAINIARPRSSRPAHSLARVPQLSDRTEETVQADVPGKASPGDGGLYRYDVCNRDLRFCGRPKDPRAHVHFHAVVRSRLVRRLVHPVR